MEPAFGTSGLRGLVSALTPELVAGYTRAYLASCAIGPVLWIGEDLRESSAAIAQEVANAALAAGVDVVMAGQVPTPALALAARGAGAVMVTGSHIPADRNGLKFYTPRGEITKADETAILAALGQPLPAGQGQLRQDEAVGTRFVERYVRSFGADRLAGRRIGVWSHAAVGRDLLASVLRLLGADVTELGRAASFVPLDTEAVPPEARLQLRAWAAAHGLDAIVSTDGDSDRPLVTDETGRVIPGDILGQITAGYLGAETVVTPVSSNGAVDGKSCFARVIRTRIGSPHVIAAMETAPGRVVGYEANGGFLLGFDAGPGLGRLPTRDSFVPILACLAAAEDRPLSALARAEMTRITAADRLQNVPGRRGQDLVSAWTTDARARQAFLAELDLQETGLDLTDGLRIATDRGVIVHLRPSGNAPELRLYVEAADDLVASETLDRGLAALRRRIFSAEGQPT